jgi:hypothetical protein
MMMKLLALVGVGILAAALTPIVRGQFRKGLPMIALSYGAGVGFGLTVLGMFPDTFAADGGYWIVAVFAAPFGSLVWGVVDLLPAKAQDEVPVPVLVSVDPSGSILSDLERPGASIAVTVEDVKSRSLYRHFRFNGKGGCYIEGDVRRVDDEDASVAFLAQGYSIREFEQRVWPKLTELKGVTWTIDKDPKDTRRRKVSATIPVEQLESLHALLKSIR